MRVPSDVLILKSKIMSETLLCVQLESKQIQILCLQIPCTDISDLKA